MLPATISENVKQQILHYIGATFDFRDKEAEYALDKFLRDPDKGLFKGPWLQVKRPYRTASEGSIPPFDIDPGFHPYKHQFLSWLRLSSKEKEPQSTMVTTGTGSGKTECFMFPVLDHCLRAKNNGQKGIKALIMYPMNALAADQERRLAATIWNMPELKKGKLTVGLYTGRFDPNDPSKGKDSGHRKMAENHGISNRKEMKQNPPDILLTNYKMLDFLLIRPEDQDLWRYNNEDVLKYLILDELHTYDGAQGSDVACLIRRLKERLNITPGKLCVVGTSATIENRSDDSDKPAGYADTTESGKDSLAYFASTLFEEKVTAESVIGEDRFDVSEIISSDIDDGSYDLPHSEKCTIIEGEDALEYALRMAKGWNAPVSEMSSEYKSEERQKQAEQWGVKLGNWIKKNSLFKNLLTLFDDIEKLGDSHLTWAQLINKISQYDIRFTSEKLTFQDKFNILNSFFAIIAHCKEIRSGKAFPLIPTNAQLWIRELRRLGMTVSNNKSFEWLDEAASDYSVLPVFQCAECGEAGWIAVHDQDSDTIIQASGISGYKLIHDPQEIYHNYFGYNGRKSTRIVILSPYSKNEEKEEDKDLGFNDNYLFTSKLVVVDGEDIKACPVSGDNRRIRVKVNRETSTDNQGNRYGSQKCPNCGTEESVFFIGSQAATIASVAIDEVFCSVLNNDPKLLAFTDSVQDASHRAGFFTARTYRFTYRTALQHIVDEVGQNGIKLDDVGENIIRYWAENKPGRPGNVKEALATLMPADLKEYQPYVKFRNNKILTEVPASLGKEIKSRLTWEAVREFGFMQTHGRTIERSGSSCLGWDGPLIEKTVTLLKSKIPTISPELLKLSDKQIKIWIYGILHRYREKGALYHNYLEAFAKQNYWGKHPFGKTVDGREIYPPAGKYKPKFIVTENKKNHEFVLSSKGRSWPVVWSKRVLNCPIDDTTLIDFIRQLLVCGEIAGLFKLIHKDGNCDYLTINSKAAVIYPNGISLTCSDSKKILVRPKEEAELWNEAPSMEYHSPEGIYKKTEFTQRQLYYQSRYRKGALRRIIATEHTGLLETDEREQLETLFASGEHKDDPNVLTCTSTLEMGIDIGDLSTTMLCSIPPTTSSYLQRIGRAGRKTGTSLILSIVNQKPHDLFFYARPEELLKGKVDPPGCWLDASAVLARQYLAFSLDNAVKSRIVEEIPGTPTRLIADMKEENGIIPRFFEWLIKNEDTLKNSFLFRFKENILNDTREKFIDETTAEVLINKIRDCVKEFDRQMRDLANARKRLNTEINKLEPHEKELRIEIERELRLIKGREFRNRRTGTLELLIDNGLLPNYAFPERGVKFFGSIYNKYNKSEGEFKPIQVQRNAAAALKELAPGNNFYTHSRKFNIQNIAIGNKENTLFEEWAVCGICAHMRLVNDLNKPEASPACPQCGHDDDNISQSDKGQRNKFLEFSRSEASSNMEYYESVSGDASDDRQQEYYKIVRSFDQTLDAPSGAVGEDSTPFGIEYRASMVLREVNTGYQDSTEMLTFGRDNPVGDGFKICIDCGAVETPGEPITYDKHRKSCIGRRRFEKARQENRDTSKAFRFENSYIYRELKSEAIRLLLPITEEEDFDTLSAAVFHGLKLRFEGNPAHIIITKQILPDPETGGDRYYMVLMDAVPGGTGYLKTLYQAKDSFDRAGEGVLDVLRKALKSLECCKCRDLSPENDTDGCYHCIRTYFYQYKAENISRERAITLLKPLVEAGEKRLEKEKLEVISSTSLFDSILEKRFIDKIYSFVLSDNGIWNKTIIKGNPGFRFKLGKSDNFWEIELHPKLGINQGVFVQSEPDFLFTSDDSSIKPIAVFTDGFKYHCYPNNILADDMQKRRSIIESGNYLLWNITWEDLENEDDILLCHNTILNYLNKLSDILKSKKKKNIPSPKSIISNGFIQFIEIIKYPNMPVWELFSKRAAFQLLSKIFNKVGVGYEFGEFQKIALNWKEGAQLSKLDFAENSEVIFTDKICSTNDFIGFSDVASIVESDFSNTKILARIDDSDTSVSGNGFLYRWRMFLAGINLYQFTGNLKFWSINECEMGTAPELFENIESSKLTDEWQSIKENVVSVIKPLINRLSDENLPIPEMEYYQDENEERFAELAWIDDSIKIAILCGEQSHFANLWQDCAWHIITENEILSKGTSWTINEIQKTLKEV